MCCSLGLLLVICISNFPVLTLVCVLADSVFGFPLGLTFQHSDLGLPFDYDSCSVLINSCFFTFTVCIWVLHFSPPNHIHSIHVQLCAQRVALPTSVPVQLLDSSHSFRGCHCLFFRPSSKYLQIVLTI